MQQVTDWLEKLGLGQYAQRFAENDISFAVLPDLTDQGQPNGANSGPQSWLVIEFGTHLLVPFQRRLLRCQLFSDHRC